VAALLSRLGDPATLVDREVSRLAVERGEAVATSAARSGRFRRRTGQASWHYPKLAGSREVQVRLFNGAKSDLVGEPRSATDAPKLTVPKQPGAAANGGDSDTAAGSAGESAESAVGVSPPVSGPQPGASGPSDPEPSDREPGAAESGAPATEPGADLSPPTLPGPEANAGGADVPAGAQAVAGGAIASAGVVAGAEAVAGAGGSEPDAGVAAPEPEAGASAPEPDADASAPEAGVAAAEPDAARAAGPAADSPSAGETPAPATPPTEPGTGAAGTPAVPRTAASRAWRRAAPRRGAAADPVGGAGPAADPVGGAGPAPAREPVPAASSGEREDPSSTARPWWPFVVARTSPEPAESAAAVMGAEPAVGRSVVAQRAAELAAACVRLARRHPLEAMAVILLGVGGAAYPPIWIIGAAIAGGSRFWDYRDKWVALLGPVLLLIVGTTLAVSLGRTQTSFGSYVHESWVYADLISRGLALLSALYLVRRLSRGKRPAVRPPWERTHKIN
jgi:hypothetical protein